MQYCGEATVSNDILWVYLELHLKYTDWLIYIHFATSVRRNEVLHGGELLKIRGLCRNKQTHSTSSSSINESTSLQYAPAESGCEKSIYDPHTDRMSSSAIIKESPVIVTSPQHLGVSAAKPPSSSSASSSSATSSAPALCSTTDQEISKRVHIKIYKSIIISYSEFA